MKRFYIDTSVFITLVKIGHAERFDCLDGEVYVPEAVAGELVSFEDVSQAGGNRDTTRLGELSENEIIELGSPEDLIEEEESAEILRRAAQQLGRDETSPSSISGDVALLALGLADDSGVIVTDDKPLRKTCKALSVPVSGSIGVLIAAVERDDLDPEEAKDALVAMDEVGARLSARLLRRAERLIDEAA